jgi:hypothetical protein
MAQAVWKKTEHFQYDENKNKNQFHGSIPKCAPRITEVRGAVLGLRMSLWVFELFFECGEFSCFMCFFYDNELILIDSYEILIF